MSSQQESFDALEELASNEIEVFLTSQVITSEKLRTWLTKTKEGKAISLEVTKKHAQAIDLFVSCGVNDIQTMQKAKMQLEVTKQTFELFSGIFEDGNNAEKQLSGEM